MDTAVPQHRSSDMTQPTDSAPPFEPTAAPLLPGDPDDDDPHIWRGLD
jgi:hypothetical protein